MKKVYLTLLLKFLMISIKLFAKPHQPNKNSIAINYGLNKNIDSPYTGEIIPLAKLFTPAYEIDHIIPQSLYFDDSLSNKVICESEVNKLKGNQLAYEFIKTIMGKKLN